MIAPASRKVYLRLIALGESPKAAAELAGHKPADFNALAKSDPSFAKQRRAALARTGRTSTQGPQAEIAVSEKQVDAYCALIERNFSEIEAAKIVGLEPQTITKAIRRTPEWLQKRTRARARKGIGTKAFLLDWAYRAIREDSKNACFAFRTIVANTPDCGLVDPAAVDEMSDPRSAKFVDAILLRSAVEEARERLHAVKAISPLDSEVASAIVDRVLQSDPHSVNNGS